MSAPDGRETGFSLRHHLRADIAAAERSGASRRGLRLWLRLFSPRLIPNLNCRIAHWLYTRKLTPLAKMFSLLNFFLFGIEIAVRCPIGPGLFLPHTQGTVLGAQTIGADVTIFQGVTLGATEVDMAYGSGLRPIIEDGVIIGAGAKVLGGVTIGQGARVGANAVVLKSVPPGVTVAGVPAQVVPKRGRQTRDA